MHIDPICQACPAHGDQAGAGIERSSLAFQQDEQGILADFLPVARDLDRALGGRRRGGKLFLPSGEKVLHCQRGLDLGRIGQHRVGIGLQRLVALPGAEFELRAGVRPGRSVAAAARQSTR